MEADGGEYDIVDPDESHHHVAAGHGDKRTADGTPTAADQSDGSLATGSIDR